MSSSKNNQDIAIGIVVYKSDLSILMQSCSILQKSALNNNLGLHFFFLDNDNGTQVNKLEELCKDNNLKNYQVISSENIGFGAGHNHIVNQCVEQTYYLCMNPDGIASPSMLINLYDFANKHNFEGIFEARQFPKEHPKEYNPDTGITNWSSGCCFFISTKLYKGLNGFDERFFMYMEDVDLSWRCRALGHQCYLVNNAVFAHYVDNTQRDMTAMLTRMYNSAIKLGHKYNNQEFIKNYQTKLRELDVEPFSPMSNQLTDCIYLEICDFEHELYFSTIKGENQ